MEGLNFAFLNTDLVFYSINSVLLCPVQVLILLTHLYVFFISFLAFLPLHQFVICLFTSIEAISSFILSEDAK